MLLYIDMDLWARPVGIWVFSPTLFMWTIGCLAWPFDVVSREQATPRLNQKYRDGTEGRGRHMLWACPKFSVRCFTPLWETFSFSSLVSTATYLIVNTAGCVYFLAQRQVEESWSFQHLHILFLLDRDSLMWSVSWQLAPAHAVLQPKPAHVG